MKRYGLIGKKLTHTFSPSYFSKKFEDEKIFNSEYKAYELETISEILQLVDSGINGLNVTIPYKEAVIPFLDEMDDTASEIMAVNTIKIEKGLLKGFNTDFYGFKTSLLEKLEPNFNGKALILGTGGASKAVAHVLKKQNIPYKFVSRTSGDLKYSDLSKDTIVDHKLIINTTPLGMYPKTDSKPDLVYEGFGNQHLAFDLIYNPEKTLFLACAEAQGAHILNGLRMLVLQAEKSWEIWNS